ncbi:MAG: type III pantothenate kinase [Tissierellaceae bacterium]
MLLVIDVGNTNIVFGIFKGNKLLYNWRISTDKNRTSDEYGLIFEQIVRYHGLDTDEIGDIMLSSVVPPLMHTLSVMCKKYFNSEPIVVGPGIKTGMDIKYDNPKEVGADRIVNGVAGYEKYGGPLIIVDFGTAITFDAISKEGNYLGGVIAPGIRISSEALFLRTAKLPKVELAKPDKTIGKNTVNSIQSGIIFGYIGLVDSILERMVEEMSVGGSNVNIVATGGFASLISGESKYIEKVDELLTLDGLRIIYERNK